jgi:hypothetical protein
MMTDSRYFDGEHKVFPVHAMKAYRENRGMASPILNLVLDGGAWSGLAALHPGKNPGTH